MAKSLEEQLARERRIRQEELFALFKQSKLRIEDIADEICVDYETARKQIYSKKGLKVKTWLKYYKLFTKAIKELDRQKDYINTGLPD